MRICMVTPHLPPEQAANALLPVVLAGELARAGVAVSFVAHPPERLDRSRSAANQAPVASGPATGVSAPVYVPRRGRGPLARSRAGALVAAARMARRIRASVRDADLVHLHSNGLVIEVAGVLARRLRVPSIVTLYGTDVWHHDPVRHRRFAEVVRGAAHRVFYSRALFDYGRARGLGAEPASVIYAPVPGVFRAASEAERRELRAELGVGDGPLLVTVKRLHPVGGHEDLVRALPAIARARPGVSLVLVGDGVLRASLEQLARELGVGKRVRFAGAVPNEVVWRYVAAADLFVLPSRLESWGTVMLEALASGTRVVATDTAGAQEVHSFFPADVALCPRENPAALASAVLAALETPRRASAEAAQVVRDRFSPAACAARYQAVYEDVVARRSAFT